LDTDTKEATAMPGALEGIRVIDFGQYIAGPLAAMLLADQGADVIRVDPPGGPRLQTPANAVWNRGKRSLVLDLRRNEDRATARRLIDTADVVVENFRPGVMDRIGLGAETMTAANPGLIYLSLPGFAHDDPRAGLAAWEGVVEAAAGRYQRQGEPVFSPIPVSSCYAAFLGAVGVAMALNARERDGLGQRIEVPLYDATFALIGYQGHRFHTQPAGVQAGAATALQGPRAAWFGEHLCIDGRYIYFHLGNKNVPDFLHVADAAEWWEAPDARERAAALFMTKTSQEWEDLAAAAGTELVVCNTSAEWLHHRHARESKMVVEVEDPTYGAMRQPGINARLSATPGTIRAPAPRPDADRASILVELDRPQPAVRASPGTSPSPDGAAGALRTVLQGVKVLDLCIVLAGPTCGRTLAEFGANVIKIDGPPRPSVLGNGRPAADIPNAFNIEVNRGKRSIILDLKTAEGQEVFWKLAEDADVIVENYRKGVIDRLGVGYEQVRRRRPDIVYAALNAYGYEGPWAGRPGHEQLAQSATGMSVRFGGDGPPRLQVSGALNDFGTGIMGAYAVALALLHRRRTGEGQFVNTALAYTACTLQSLFMYDFEGKTWDEPKGQEAKGLGPIYRLYQAADRWLFLGAREADLPALATVDGLAGAASLNGPALERFLEERFTALPAATWVEHLAGAGIAAHVLTTTREVMDDPWAKAHGLSITREHEGFGLVDTTGPSPRLSRTPVVPGRPAPKYGADTEAILAEHGLAGERDRLVGAGAVRSSP
jgi:crotonobetainyl-CoA:carnitine CoA-transferase CaiB-like acyl-CoA transferase